MPAFRYPSNAVNVLPDHEGDRYRFRFRTMGSSGSIYTISYDSAPGAGYWVCSCPGSTYRGDCKHLRAAGLLGRMFGKSPMPERAPERAERVVVAVRRTRKAVAVPAPKRRTMATKRAESMTAEEAFILSAPPELLAELATI